MIRLQMLAYHTLPYLILMCGCSAHTQATLRFDYHGFNEVQAAELDCVLEIVSEHLPYASGDIFLVDYIQQHDDTRIWGRTFGRDDQLTIQMIDLPDMPYILVHELMHVLAGQETETRDGDHTNPRYFGKDSLTETLGAQALGFCKPKGF